MRHNPHELKASTILAVTYLTIAVAFIAYHLIATIQ